MKSLQDTFAPKSICFGCGPANRKGLRIKSRVEGDLFVAEWKASPQHHAFEGVVNGGIIGTILDCHSNWAAAYSLMKKAGAKTVPATVTAEYSVKLLKPTPTGRVLRLEAKVVDLQGRKARVECSLSDGKGITATFSGVFVAVGQAHPAFARWA